MLYSSLCCAKFSHAIRPGPDHSINLRRRLLFFGCALAVVIVSTLFVFWCLDLTITELASKINLSPSVASAAVCSSSAVVYSLFIVAPIVCGVLC